MEWITFENKCWWCGGTDISAEHKYKKADLEREYFSTTKDISTRIVLCNLSDPNEKGKGIRGPKSEMVKFKPTLCQNCNNARSQPFDKSYDIFIQFLKANETNTLNSPKINFEKVYGERWQSQVINLERYFMKHLGCTLSDSNISVPQNIIDFLEGTDQLRNIELVLSQSIDRKEYLDNISKQIKPASWIGCSDVLAEFNKKTKSINFVKYELYYRSFSFYINLDSSITGLKTNFTNDSIDLILYREQYFKELNADSSQTQYNV